MIRDNDVSDECTYISVDDFNLPSHKGELSTAEHSINKLATKIDRIISNRTIDGNTHTELYEEVVRVLDYVGRLSLSVFRIFNDLEIQYLTRYKKSPAMAKKLWIDHYHTLHKPYNNVKNKCFRYLDELDIAYLNKFGKNPPNWNP